MGAQSGNSGVISITNTSQEQRLVHVTFLVNGRMQELPAIQIAPRRTRVLPIDQLVARSHENGAGIHIAFDEYPGDILVEGQLFNPRTGFAKYIHFADKALQYPTDTLRTHFLLLGNQPEGDGFPAGVSFHSVVAVRNIDSVPVEVTPTIKFLENGLVQSIPLNPLALGVGESRIVDLSREQEMGRFPADLHQASLELVPANDHGSMVAELFNFDGSNGGYVVGPSFTSYPNRGTASIWRIDGTFQTTVMVENTADQDDQVSLKLYSDSGTYNKIFPVASGGLLKINLRELQQDAVPDKDGHLLTGTSGILSIVGSHNVRSKLTFDKIIHSSDQANYVGETANPCDFVSNISLFVDFSGGQNPFPIMAEYDWSQSGIVDEAAINTSSNDSSIAQIANNDSGDMLTLNPPNDGQTHTVSISSPPIDTTFCEACSAGDMFPAAADFQVELAYTRLKPIPPPTCVTGGGQTLCTVPVAKWCTTATSPPDYNPASVQGLNVPNFPAPFYDSHSVCFRATGNPWTCTPGAGIPLGDGQPLAFCTHNP